MIKTISALAVAAAFAAGPGMARELIYGSWLGANNDTNLKALQPYFDKVKEATNGSIEWTLVPGAQLANGPATPEAVESALMDAGLVMAPYQPSMLPATNMIFSQSLIGDDYLASVGAMNEAVMLGCPDCTEEYHENNAVAFAGYGTSPYLFMCRGDVPDMDSLKDKKVRASGGGVNIVELIGATPVSMPPSEATSALERGTIDCVLGAVAWLKSYGYMDVVGSVINAPMGMGGPPMMMYVNRDAWAAMTPEERKAHIELAPDLVEMTVFDAQIPVDNETIENAKAKGIKFYDGGAPFEDIMNQRDEIQYKLNVETAEGNGISDAKGIMDAYLAAYDKWKGIIDNEVGDDRQKFRDALWREVYSKVDPENL